MRKRRRLTTSQRRSREYKQRLSYMMDSYCRLMDAFLVLASEHGYMSTEARSKLVRERVHAYAKVRARTGIVD